MDKDLETKDKVRPQHYGGENNPFEAIKVIDYYNFNFNVGNVVKYSFRAGKKDTESALDDMRKTAWYAMREVKRLENELAANTKSAS